MTLSGLMLLLSVYTPVLALQTSTDQGTSFLLEATPLPEDSTTVMLIVVLQDASNGLRTVDLEINFDTTGLVQIFQLEPLGAWPTRVTKQTDKSVGLRIVDLFNLLRPGVHQIPLVRIRVKAMVEARTTASLRIARLQDDYGQEVSIPSVATVLVFAGKMAQEEPTILRAGDVTLKVGEQTQGAIILGQAPQGLQSADIVFSMQDPAVARFTAIAPGVLSGDAFMILEQGADKIRIRLLDLLTHQLEAGARDQILAQLTLEGLQAGRTQLLIEVVAYIDDSGNSVTPVIIAGQIAVAGSKTPEPPLPQPSSETTLLLAGPPSLMPQAEGIVDLILTKAPQGLQRYAVIVRVSDPALVQLDGATVPGLDPRFVRVMQHSEGVMEIRAVDFRNGIRPGAESIILAQMALTALGPGRVEFSMEVNVLTDDASRPMAATLQNFTLAIVLPPVDDALRSPQDLDGDGLFEDVNGDGAFTIEDAISFAFNYDSEPVQKFSRYYDFDGDGLVSFADAQRLMQMALQEGRMG